MTIDGCFERYTSRVTTARLAEEEKMNNSDFRPVCRFKIIILLLRVAITTADWNRLYKLLDVHLDGSISSLAMISP